MANKVKWMVAIGLWLFIAYAFVGPFVTYRTYDIRICPITGSTLTHRTFLGRAQPPERKVTALENWLRLREPEFEPQWQHLSRAEIRIAGGRYACGRAPEIYGYRRSLENMLAHMMDEEIAEMVEILRHGSKEEQRSVLDRHFRTTMKAD